MENKGKIKDLKFALELEKLINKYSIENGSNTPDFILANYLITCLENFNSITNNREQWYSRPMSIPLEDDHHPEN